MGGGITSCSNKFYDNDKYVQSLFYEAGIGFNPCLVSKWFEIQCDAHYKNYIYSNLNLTLEELNHKVMIDEVITKKKKILSSPILMLFQRLFSQWSTGGEILKNVLTCQMAQKSAIKAPMA